MAALRVNSFYEYLLVMVGCGTALPAEEKESLLKWEHENLGDSRCLGTADWPGWVKYIGPPPVPEETTPKSSQGRVYLIRNEVNGFVKIGFSVRPELREKTLQPEEPAIALIGSIPGNKKIERSIHAKYAQKRIRGEWFRLADSDVQEILG